jgi:flagellar protein FliT
MHNNSTLNLYADMVEISNQMLVATKAKDWELLESLEAYCAHRIQILGTQDQAELTGAELNQKIDYIGKILATDREIRSLVEPWMARLSAMMHSDGNQQKLSNSYGRDFSH